MNGNIWILLPPVARVSAKPASVANCNKVVAPSFSATCTMLPSWLNAIPIKAKNRITFMAADWRPALELFLLYRTHHVYQIYLISYLCCIIQDFRLVTRDSHGDLYSTYYSPVQVCWLLIKTWEIRLDQPIWLLLSSIELLVHPKYFDTETVLVTYSAIRKKLSKMCKPLYYYSVFN